jgi:hypothetical protein
MAVHHADGSVEIVSDTKAMDYGAVVVPLVKAVQQLKAQNEALKQANDNAVKEFKAANDNASAQNAVLLKAIDELETANSRLKAANDNMRTEIDALKKAVYGK